MTEPSLTMAALNDASDADFAAALGDLFEHSPWVAERVAASRPFPTARALHEAMMRRLGDAGPDAQLRLLAAHPELAGREAAEEALTLDSAGEQGRLGFDRLPHAEHTELAALNAAYRARFGFPFVAALCRHASRHAVMAELRRRLHADPEAERATAIAEVGHITLARLAARLGRANGTLTVHALDTVVGGGAPGLGLSLHAIGPSGCTLLAQRRTNGEGRLDEPLLPGIDMEPGAYRIDYEIGAYHRARGIVLDEPAFLEVVGIGFGIADPGRHYHVPIQFTPWSYAVYRGG